MKALILSFSLLLNCYSLAIPMQKSPSYDKHVEQIEMTTDLKTIQKRFFQEKDIHFKQLFAENDLAESGKGSSIYFVFDKNDQNIAIVKQIPLDDHIDKQELIDEVCSLQERYFVSTQYVKVPKLIGVAEFSSMERNFGYIIESTAPGSSINSLVKKVASSRNIERERLFEKLNVGVKNSAKAFAELHQLKNRSSYNSYYDEYYKGIQESPFSGPYGIVHGDAHLGNIFYDTKTQQVTFIDLSFMPRSFKGAPVGIDSGKFIFNLEAIGAFYGLHKKEIATLKKSYIETYLSSNPAFTKEMIEDYTLLAYKDFAHTEETYTADRYDQGSFLYQFAAKKVAENYSS